MEIDIPFGAKDSELKEWRYTIPEGYTAEIKDGEIIVKSTESEDERMRKGLIEFIKSLLCNDAFDRYKLRSWIAWLEKQRTKERLDRMAPIYNDKESFESALEKAWKYYNESASRTVDSFEDDYIECVFSKGFREGFLYKEKQKEQKPVECINIEELAKHIKTEFESFRNLLKKKGIDYQPTDGYWNGYARLFVSFAKKLQKSTEWKPTEEEIILSKLPDYTPTNLSPYIEHGQEWSEEDKEIIGWACCYLGDYAASFKDKNERKSNMLYELSSKLNSLSTKIK